MQQPFFVITTDKGIYQPGQVLHARALVLDPSRRARANESLTLSIKDEENHEQFNKELITSNFGIASADWTIPDSAKLGEYRVEFETQTDQSASASVKISRYELPNFSVNVKPDRPYYLPGENATVEISANYLFGEAVKRGHVRVVHESERLWNYKEQRYETEEDEKYEGEVDEKGVFRVQIDLTDHQEDLAQEDYSRYRDVNYAAYFTDPTTNRTEQRRFDLRLTREAIHLYVVRIGNGYAESRHLPLSFYVTASYADGNPAQVNLSLNETRSDKKRAFASSVRTNRYGLAKIKASLPDKTSDDLALGFVARDRSGKTGTHNEEFQLTDEEVVRVESKKALYARGEPIEFTITSSQPNPTLLVQLSQDWAVIDSQLVRLHDGQAVVIIPYQPRFKGPLTISALGNFAGEHRVLGSQTILYPDDQELKVQLKSAQESYQPGDEARLDFRVRGANGQLKESALGVVVFDKAVEERTRTDQEFGSRSYGFYDSALGLLGYQDAIAGISRRDLNRINVSRPVPADLDLAAEVLLNQSSEYYPTIFGGAGYERDQASLFNVTVMRQLQPVSDALLLHYDRTREYPKDQSLFYRTLNEFHVDFKELRDPWGVPYHSSFYADKDKDVLAISTSGPDKVFGTSDDFVARTYSWPYFRSPGEAIDRAASSYHKGTRSFIRDLPTLREELERSGIDLNSLRDPWGHPYKANFGVDETSYVIEISSEGPNGRFEAPWEITDDFKLWRSAIDYFVESRERIQQSLSNHLEESHRFPQNERELRAAVQASGIDPESLVDGWKHPLYAEFSTAKFTTQRSSVQSEANYGQALRDRIVTVPVAATVSTINLRSPGPDGIRATADDFTAGSFSSVVSEPIINQVASLQPRIRVSSPGTTGAISGKVLDAMGAAVPGASVRATNSTTSQEFVSETDDDGQFLLKDLPAGLYTVRVDAQGFKAAVLSNVLVRSMTLAEVNVTVEPGAVTETVSVTAAETKTQLSSSAVASLRVDGKNLSLLKMKPATTLQQLSTPRVREYFPETLVWHPQLETDKQGRAQLKFKLADNITTWKVSVISSTVDGELGIADAEIKAFQPFFVEHDPPRVLTEGDQISLPVVLRNYLDQPQVVNVEMKPESWFELTGPASQRISVPATEAARQIFDLRAIASVKDGKQRVTALGSEASDAIEKPVTVHPDGEEIFETSGSLVSDISTLDVNVPESAIPGSVRSRLKIYPNLIAHVAESVEGILERPHGCGEQTISSTYPSLLLLQHRRSSGAESALQGRARNYLNIGYNRLLTYRHSGGGFSYWGGGEPDIALTAYALRFLTDARVLIDVDDDVITQAAAWLMKVQRPDGGWSRWAYSRDGSAAIDYILTAYVARVLARTSRPATGAVAGKTKMTPELRKALDLIAKQIESSSEPYLLASFVLANVEAGDAAAAGQALTKLRSLAKKDGNSTYWSLGTNTPFYGWGLAGQVETTALAVQALARSRELNPNQSDEELIRNGLITLLKQKDRYGVWYSTQATINVLDTLLTLLARNGPGPGPGTIEVLVNGAPVNVPTPSNDEANSPLVLDISQAIRPGANRIQVRRSAGSYASAQTVTSYYIPWSISPNLTGTSRSPALSVAFDKNEARVNDAINCHVKVSRPGKEWGMMLTEIGLPPGAEVDRESLEKVLKNSNWSINQYDVLPDRVVFYVWPQRDVSEFDFQFRPRFALKAKSAPSNVYDYYNPEAKAVVAPTTFVVR
jgi:hypothetical protein